MKKILLFALFAVLSATNFYCTKTEDINTATEGIQQNLPEQAAPVTDRDGNCSGMVKIKLLSINGANAGTCVQVPYYRHYCEQSYYVASLTWSPNDPSLERAIPIQNDENLGLSSLIYRCSTGQFASLSSSATFEITMPGKTPYTVTINNQTTHFTPKFYGNGLNCAYHYCGGEEG